MSDEGWLTVDEAARSMRIGRTAVYELVSQGKLACYRMGPNRGRLRFKQADLNAYAESVRVGPRPAASPEPRRVAYVPKNDLSKPRRVNR